MASYILSCCSTVDLSEEHLKERDIHYIPFHFRLDGKDYPDNFGASLSYKDFYQAMREHLPAATSQVNMSEYLNYFEGFLKEGLDILHVCFSSGLSGTYNSCMNAARIARERYPERTIIIIDSLAASSGYGLLMNTLADLRDTGMSIESLSAWAEENKLRVHHLFFSTDLSYYVQGGRISRAGAIFGGLLNICPFLNMNHEGRLIPRERPRGKQMAMKRMLAKMEELADNGTLYDGPVYICHSDCIDDANQVADMVKERFQSVKEPVRIYYVGTTIGVHTGPGTVALFFFGKKREN